MLRKVSDGCFQVEASNAPIETAGYQVVGDVKVEFVLAVFICGALN